MFHWTDIRYSLRLLRRSPGFSALTVLTLAGGLGVSIFTFSFLHTAMLAPLPIPRGERIVRVENAEPGSAAMFDVVDVAAIRSSIRSLAATGVYTNSDQVIGDARHRRVLSTTLAEPNIFELTGTRPMLGRPFRAEDQAAGAEPVIVLSHRAWQLAFGGDSGVVGRVVALNSGYTRVIGVMPAGYGFPVASDAWAPLPLAALNENTPGRASVNLFGRLAEESTARGATTEIARLIDRAREQRTSIGAPPRSAVNVRSYPMAQFGDQGPLFLTVLNVLAGLILLLACINVTNLLLARANERARETAVRLALGASHGRLMMQSMWENVIVCLLGGAVAVAIAGWGLDAINHWLQANLADNLAFWWVWKLDRSAILSACAFVSAAILLLGLVVTARVTSTRFNEVLRDGGARTGSRREGRIARILVVAQVSAVTVLMFFGVMAAVVAYRIAHVDVGYDTRRLLSAVVDLPNEGYADADRRWAFYQRLSGDLAANAAIDGVLLRASIAARTDVGGAFEPAESPRTVDAASPRAYVQGVLGPLQTIGIGLRAGRLFDDRDDQRGTPVALVSRALAEREWPGRSPVGRRIRLAADSGRVESREIVGVVSDVLLGVAFSKSRSADAIYVPFAQTAMSRPALLFRHRGDAPAAQGALYGALEAIDPRVAPPSVQTFDEILTKSSLIALSVMKLFALCFGFALVLAVSGAYGLMARSIGQRAREIGIRRALGATESAVARLLVGQGGRQLGVGVLLALPVVVGTGIGFSSFFPVGLATTLACVAGVTLSIIGVVLLATYIPTRRALTVSPRDALWRE